MMNFLNLSEFKIGRKQQSGIMSVYPLLGEDVSTPLASFDEIQFRGTTGYGHMQFCNESDFPFIIPTGFAFMTKQLAQDHALPFASLLHPRGTQTFPYACCIQQTQGGYISNQDNRKEFALLPLYIRKREMEQQLRLNSSGTLKDLYTLSFSRLWDHISSFQKDLVHQNEGNLVLFFNKFMDSLAQFNAEFEVVNGQRGAVILLNDKIVGIEIAPTQAYWKTVWNSLIRDCYGSEVIRLTTQNLVKEFETSLDHELHLENCKTIEEIEQTMEAYYDQEREYLQTLLESLEEQAVLEVSSRSDLVKENSLNDITYHLLKMKEAPVYGEVYTDKDQMIYASILCS